MAIAGKKIAKIKAIAEKEADSDWKRFFGYDGKNITTWQQFISLVKKDKREEFMKDYNNWFPRTDTKENIAYDQRKPGIFKFEFVGTGMVALAPKSYCAKYGEGKEDIKLSSKGCNQKTNKSLLTFEKYKQCLVDGVYMYGTNIGFRVIDHEIRTYEQVKIGLNPLYDKRRLMEDRITTVPLHI
jgi:hypothetical protein